MSTRFNPREGLVVVRARLRGPSRTVELRMAIDTGATSTLISHAMLTAAGYDPATSPEEIEMVTGSGTESASVIRVQSLRAIGKQMRKLSLVAHTLPPTARIDGVIGLDFLRGEKLTIDFVAGSITLGSRRTK